MGNGAFYVASIDGSYCYWAMYYRPLLQVASAKSSAKGPRLIEFWIGLPLHVFTTDEPMVGLSKVSREEKGNTMGKDRAKNVNWEPDVRKSMEIQSNLKDINQRLKDDADRRKIDGFNAGDVGSKK